MNMTKETEIVVEGFSETDFERPAHRKLIDEKREEYLAKGGTIKRFIPPFMPTNFYHCDVFTPGEGSSQSAPGVKDTMVRKPLPEKKFGKK